MGSMSGRNPCHPPTAPEALQSSVRSIRDKPTIIGIGYNQWRIEPCLPARAGAAVHREIPGLSCGISTEPKKLEVSVSTKC